jgi:hypothetical protein
MDYNKIKKYISAARLVRYEQVCNGDQQKVLKLYQANLRLSQSFYPLLSLFEVVLRNAINEELTSYFNDSDWLRNQVNGFMSDPTLTYFNQLLQKQVTNDILKKNVTSILRKNSGITHGKIISDLNFAFWTQLFENTHYQILQGHPIQIFTNLPLGMNRNKLNQKLNRIRSFRNRISHHEPIIFAVQNNQTVFNLSNPNEIYTDILDIFTWLDLDFNEWTRKINHVSFEIQRTEYVYMSYPKLQYYFIRLQLGLQLYGNKYLKK